VPDNEFDGIQELSDEWANLFSARQDSALLDIPGRYMWPAAYVTPGAPGDELFVHTTMVSVGAATNVNEFNGQVGSFPNPTGFTPKSPNRVHDRCAR